jgi:hypothetical protein
MDCRSDAGGPSIPDIAGASEADGVIFESLPLDEEDVAARILDRAAEFVGDVAACAGEDGDGAAEVCLKCWFLAGDDVEGGDFEDHILHTSAGHFDDAVKLCREHEDQIQTA